MIKPQLSNVTWVAETKFYRLQKFQNQFNNPLLEPIFILKVWDFVNSKGHSFECNELGKLSHLIEFLND